MKFVITNSKLYMLYNNQVQHQKQGDISHLCHDSHSTQATQLALIARAELTYI